MQRTKGQQLISGIIILVEIIGLWYQNGLERWYNITYYTTLSNLLVLGFFAYWLWRLAKEGSDQLVSYRLWRFKGAVTMAILLTFFVYLILLMPRATMVQIMRVENFALHMIAPVLVLVDWALFDRKGQYRLLEPVYWTVLPLLYMAYALVRGYALRLPIIPSKPGDYYPYFFMNIDKIGWQGFGRYFCMILFVYLMLGYGLYGLKRAKS